MAGFLFQSTQDSFNDAFSAYTGGAGGASSNMDLVGMGLQAAGGIFANMQGKDSAERSIAFQREAMQNRHQWEVADLRAAGLNPILSAMNTSNSAQPSGAISQFKNPAEGLAANASQAKRLREAELSLIDAQKQNIQADTLAKTANANATQLSTNLLPYQMENLYSNTMLNRAYGDVQSEIKNNLIKQGAKIDQEIVNLVSQLVVNEAVANNQNAQAGLANEQALTQNFVRDNLKKQGFMYDAQGNMYNAQTHVFLSQADLNNLDKVGRAAYAEFYKNNPNFITYEKYADLGGKVATGIRDVSVGYGAVTAGRGISSKPSIGVPNNSNFDILSPSDIGTIMKYLK